MLHGRLSQRSHPQLSTTSNLRTKVLDLGHVHFTQAQFKCAANFHWVSRQSTEGCGVRVNWSFFESCHGKCYCDPEGGTLKNAARHHELTLSDKASQLKDSIDLFLWARDMSGLATPKLTLFQKKGKGIYRRFFYWIPSKGVGAVDRSRLPKFLAEGTSRLHEFVDIGVPGVVLTRRASCHRCHACWCFNFHECLNQDYVGKPSELQIRREVVPSRAAERVEQATLHREAVTRASEASIGSVICIETHKDEQSHPWVIGEVVEGLHNATANSRPYDSNLDPVRFDQVKVNEPGAGAAGTAI